MKKLKILLGILLSLTCGLVLVFLSSLALIFLADKLNISLGFITILIIIVVSAVLPFFILVYIARSLKLEHTKIYYILFIIFNFFTFSIVYLAIQPRGGHTLSGRVLSDVRTYATALEIYNKEKGLYPNYLNELRPLYIGPLPERIYSRIKSCSSKKAIFDYQTFFPNKYLLKFCLEDETGGYKPGIHILTQDGIK